MNFFGAISNMIGLVVIFGVLTACSADDYVERELLQIRATLHRQEMEIKELRSENRVLRTDVDRLNVEIERLRNGPDNAPGYNDDIPGNEKKCTKQGT
jgi:peptidoglycan hydrolase CwlO-like protein